MRKVKPRHCSRCGQMQTASLNYCAPCRSWLMADQAQRLRARGIANVYLSRGKIQREGCEVCGGRAEMHHDDYYKPLVVRWLCREHHLAWHAENDQPGFLVPHKSEDAA